MSLLSKRIVVGETIADKTKGESLNFKPPKADKKNKKRYKMVSNKKNPHMYDVSICISSLI